MVYINRRQVTLARSRHVTHVGDFLIYNTNYIRSDSSDDGGWANPGVRIAANSFNLEEIKILVSILENKFSLSCTIQHLKDIDKYSIYV